MRFWKRLILTAALPPVACSAGEKIMLREGFPFVNATVNGRGPFRLLIDTGAAVSMLTPNAAREAGLTYDHRVVLATMGGDKTIPAASNNRVAIGTAERSGIEIDVLDLPQVRGLDQRADGVLGQNFFGDSAYLIDYKQKKLWLGDDAVARAGDLPIAIEAARLQGRIVLPVTLERGSAPWRLTLDSGASDLVVACNERCPPMAAVEPAGRLLTYAGDRPVSRGRLRNVEVGGMKIPFVEAVLVESAASEGEDDGVLPARWFSAIYVDGGRVRLARAR